MSAWADSMPWQWLLIMAILAVVAVGMLLSGIVITLLDHRDEQRAIEDQACARSFGDLSDMGDAA